MKRRSGPIASASFTVCLVPSSPFVEGFARKAEVPAGLSYASGQVICLPQELQTPGNHSVLFVLVHGLSPGSRREPECHLSSETSQPAARSALDPLLPAANVSLPPRESAFASQITANGERANSAWHRISSSLSRTEAPRAGPGRSRLKNHQKRYSFDGERYQRTAATRISAGTSPMR